MTKYVITISRQFASMGHAIAEKLSEKLDIPFYDRDIVEKAAVKINRSLGTVCSEEESLGNGPLLISPYQSLLSPYSINEEIFLAERQVILDMADKGSCILVGRCSDYILKDHPDKLRVYITAPYEVRLKNCKENLLMDEKTARKNLKSVDAEREAYRKKFCRGYKNPYDCQDVALDSSCLGIDGSAELLAAMARIKFDL